MTRLPGASRFPEIPAWLYAVGGAIAFLFAVQLLGRATAAFAPDVERLFRLYVVDAPSALGASWLASYVVNNGSVVAAVAVTLFDAGILTDVELFMLVGGTRLGGAGVVVLVGAIDHLHNPRATVRRSVSMGVLTFLAAIAVFTPAVPVGYAVVDRFPSTRALDDIAGTGLALPDPLSPVVAAIVGAVGWLAFPIAVALLIAALDGFHRAFDRVDTRALRERYLAYLNHRWMLFGLGALVTGLTTSVAFSLGVVVPLYNRGTVSPREALPYILGANVATLSDTLLVAVVLGTPVAVAVVTVLVLAATAVTLAALLWFDPFADAVLGLLDRIVEHRAAFAVFTGALIALPVLLVVA